MRIAPEPVQRGHPSVCESPLGSPEFGVKVMPRRILVLINTILYVDDVLVLLEVSSDWRVSAAWAPTPTKLLTRSSVHLCTWYIVKFRALSETKNNNVPWLLQVCLEWRWFKRHINKWLFFSWFFFFFFGWTCWSRDEGKGRWQQSPLKRHQHFFLNYFMTCGQKTAPTTHQHLQPPYFGSHKVVCSLSCQSRCALTTESLPKLLVGSKAMQKLSML